MFKDEGYETLTRNCDKCHDSVPFYKLMSDLERKNNNNNNNLLLLLFVNPGGRGAL